MFRLFSKKIEKVESKEVERDVYEGIYRIVYAEKLTNKKINELKESFDKTRRRFMVVTEAEYNFIKDFVGTKVVLLLAYDSEDEKILIELLKDKNINLLKVLKEELGIDDLTNTLKISLYDGRELIALKDSELDLSKELIGFRVYCEGKDEIVAVICNKTIVNFNVTKLYKNILTIRNSSIKSIEEFTKKN